MTTDQVLAILKDRGLRVEIREGIPHLSGPKTERTERLLRVLKLHREEIIARLRPKPTRRVVLLVGDEDSAVERVLSESDPRALAGLTRQLAAKYPGRVVASEWLLGLPGGEVRWVRYLKIRCPGEQSGTSAELSATPNAT